ncbi:putative mucin/carbohydrate-binding domain-containing protein [Candidatus Tisiphia endosymbiont of Nemotelus uliginosus]|uniref:putative mucin/carbohydrate-binding domain-containing protein n=1 Tax=Candidatus Tisiphia endosymbiont of Nemotelus uliginosus TaxID=3077926 RepID=UPI0035C8CB9D
MGIITKSQQITTLQRPTWLAKAGMGKGVDNDRQHLGIILDAEQVIKVRQTNKDFTDKLTLRLLNDGTKLSDGTQTESWVSFGSDWVEVSAKAASVPFIDTPYTASPHSPIIPAVEFEYPDIAKTLPVYHKGENESEFFTLWDRQNAEFALIDSQYAMILVPSADKDYLKSIGKADNKAADKVDNIDGLIDYYTDIFSHYNEWAGLSFEPQRPTDLNIANRYFFKEDKGAGAFYSDSKWIADPYPSLIDTWLPPGDQWAILHEAGHTLEVGIPSRDLGYGAVDIGTNIYAASYQKMTLGDRKYKEVGWMRDPRLEKDIPDFINTGKPLNEWDALTKLHFMMMMVEKAGLNAFTHFNQQYRLLSNSSDFVREDHELLDMLSASFAVAGNQVDVTPFVQLVKGYLTPFQRGHNSLSHAKAVYPLNQLVQEPKLTELQQELHLITPFNLVDVQQLRFSGIKNDVKLRLNIDDFRQISGENLILWDGGREAAELPINSQDLALGKLPIGVYTMRLPTGKDKKYDIQSNYLVVKQDDHNQQQVDFVHKIGSPLANQTIDILGLGYALIATVRVDHSKGKVMMDVVSQNPNIEHQVPNYSQVVVRNKVNVEKFSKAIPGANATLSHDEISFSFGDKIEIYNDNLSAGMHSRPSSDSILDLQSKTNILEITPSGLKNEALGKDSQDSLLLCLEKAAAALRGDPLMLNASFAGPKDDIYLAIDTFTSPQREELLEKYADCIPTNNAAPSDKLTVQSSKKINLVQLQKDLEPHEHDISAMSQANSSNILPAATTQILDVLGATQGIDMAPTMEL